MQGIIYEEPSAWLFVFVTVLLGGWTAWMSGRALAMTWRPIWQVVVWAIPLAGVVRFIHFALFEGTLLSARYYLIDFAVVVAIALVGYRYVLTRKMTTQYRWLYERAGPLAWRERGQS